MGKDTTNGNGQGKLSYTPAVGEKIKPEVRKGKPAAGAEVIPESMQKLFDQLQAQVNALKQENKVLAEKAQKKQAKRELDVRLAKSGTVVVSGPIRTMAYYPWEWEVVVQLCQDKAFVAKLQSFNDTDEVKAALDRKEKGIRWADVKPQKGEQADD